MLSHIGPQLYQNGPALSQIGPMLSQIGPTLSQISPTLSQIGFTLSHFSRVLSQIGPTLSQSTVSQIGPTLSQTGPLAITNAIMSVALAFDLILTPFLTVRNHHRKSGSKLWQRLKVKLCKQYGKRPLLISSRR